MMQERTKTFFKLQVSLNLFSKCHSAIASQYGGRGDLIYDMGPSINDVTAIGGGFRDFMTTLLKP